MLLLPRFTVPLAAHRPPPAGRPSRSRTRASALAVDRGPALWPTSRAVTAEQLARRTDAVRAPRACPEGKRPTASVVVAQSSVTVEQAVWNSVVPPVTVHSIPNVPPRNEPACSGVNSA